MHYFNEPTIFDYVFAVVKQFMKEKTVSRVRQLSLNIKEETANFATVSSLMSNLYEFESNVLLSYNLFFYLQFVTDKQNTLGSTMLPNHSHLRVTFEKCE